jgi:hypothetical protein
LSIQKALEWAFGAEHAQLDFDDLRPQGARPGCDTIYRLIQQGALGCQIDGSSGPARVAHDAEVIANAVVDLPLALGGKPMAVAVAGWARAGIAPDWQVDMTKRCVPLAWAKQNQHGQFARTEQIGEEIIISKGRAVRHAVLCCPVVHIAPSAHQIGNRRRTWLGWYGALLHIHGVLSRPGTLSRLLLTPAMPPLEPWKNNYRSDDKAA